MGSSGVLVSNVESLGSITTGSPAGAAGFTVFDLYPGNLGWLSGLALSYSKYRWRRLRIFYVPSVSTSVSGRIAFSLKYDTADNIPTTMGQVIASNRAIFGPLYAGTGSLDSSKPFGATGLMHTDVDCANFDKSWYQVGSTTAVGGLSGVDRNMYIPVSILAGVDGAPASQTVGFFYAAYEVELIEPISFSLNQ